MMTLPPSGIAANRNDAGSVQAEIDDPGFLESLARAAGVSVKRVRRLSIRVEDDVASWSASSSVDPRVADALTAYLARRASGHSAAYCRATIGLDRSAPPSAQFAFLADLPASAGPIPEGWIHSVIRATNSAGGRLVGIVVVDGELAWSYALSQKPDGSLDYCHVGRTDALEYSPAHTNVIAEVEQLVEQKMREEGAAGTFGSCHQSWQLKKELLKERGVEWRSPPELNPGTCYD